MPLDNGKIIFRNDFNGLYDAMTVSTGATYLGGGVSLVGVNEGSIASTVDETGGIIAITTDTGDNDNHGLTSAKFSPDEGTLTLKTRFKWNNSDIALWVGFVETLSTATPVMPSEIATATMTYGAVGGMVGLSYDDDASTNAWRTVIADGAANIGGSASANGVVTTLATTTDSFVEVVVNLFPDGSSEIWGGSAADVNADNEPELRLLASNSGSAALTPTDLFSPLLLIENRDGSANVLEVDVFEGYAGRNWAV